MDGSCGEPRQDLVPDCGNGTANANGTEPRLGAEVGRGEGKKMRGEREMRNGEKKQRGCWKTNKGEWRVTGKEGEGKTFAM